MVIQKLTPNDSRVEHRFLEIRGKRYHYLLGTPSNGRPQATLLLIHGFPDLSFGWRYQVPYLVSLGLRVVVPDMLGYGQTDSPVELSAFSMKSVSDDMAELVRQYVGAEGQILLGGHDWGGALVWRMALWHPTLIKAVFSVCTPYAPPLPIYLDTKAVVTYVPSFAYQIQLEGPDVEREIVGEGKLRQFFNAMFGERGTGGEKAFSKKAGVLFEQLPNVQPSTLLDKAELDFYVKEYARNGMRGPLNWYRTRKVNFEEEKALFDAGRTRIAVPSMIIIAKNDVFLPPAMSIGMEDHFDNLRKELVQADHWAMIEAADEVNHIIQDFLLGVIGPAGPKALL